MIDNALKDRDLLIWAIRTKRVTWNAFSQRIQFDGESFFCDLYHSGRLRLTAELRTLMSEAYFSEFVEETGIESQIAANEAVEAQDRALLVWAVMHRDAQWDLNENCFTFEDQDYQLAPDCLGAPTLTPTLRQVLSFAKKKWEAANASLEPDQIGCA